MDRLEESLKRIMQVAAVIGREFAFRILETITEMKENLKSGLVNLQGLEFIYEKSLFPDLEYIFRHALVQEVAYNSLLIQPPEGDSREDRPGHRAALSGETGRVLRDAGLSLFEERESGQGLRVSQKVGGEGGPERRRV